MDPELDPTDIPAADEAVDADLEAGEDETMEHDGIALLLLPADGEPLAVDGGDPADELHLTLVMVADEAAGFDIPGLAAAIEPVVQNAIELGPITCTISDVVPLGDDGAIVLVLTGDDPAMLAEALLAAMTDAGITPATGEQFPEFVPHVTIGYAADETAATAMIAAAGGMVGQEIVFDRLALSIADDIAARELGGDPEAPEVDPATGAEGEAGEVEVEMSAAPDWVDRFGVLAPSGIYASRKRQLSNALHDDAGRFAPKGASAAELAAKPKLPPVLVGLRVADPGTVELSPSPDGPLPYFVDGTPYLALFEVRADPAAVAQALSGATIPGVQGTVKEALSASGPLRRAVLIEPGGIVAAYQAMKEALVSAELKPGDYPFAVQIGATTKEVARGLAGQELAFDGIIVVTADGTVVETGAAAAPEAPETVTFAADAAPEMTETEATPGTVCVYVTNGDARAVIADVTLTDTIDAAAVTDALNGMTVQITQGNADIGELQAKLDELGVVADLHDDMSDFADADGPFGLVVEAKPAADPADTIDQPVDPGGDIPLEMAATAADPLTDDGALTADDDGAWEGILTVEGVPSGDKRTIKTGALSWRDLPLPLMMMTRNPEGGAGHDGAQLAGRIDEIERVEVQDGVVEVWGRGVLDMGSDAGREARRLMDPKVRMLRGVSADLDDVEMSIEGGDEMGSEIDALFGDGRMIVEKGRIMGATLTPFPAFQQAYLVLLGDALTAAAGLLGEGCDCSAEFALAAAAGDPTPGAQVRVFTPWAYNDQGALVASGAQQIPIDPPREFFANTPVIDQPYPMRLDADGRYHGYPSAWGSCHIGFADRCVQTPRSKSNYAGFVGKRTMCADGTYVLTGPVMIDAVHPNLRLNASDTSAFYAHTGSAVADVTIYENKHGVFVTGAIRPGVTAAQLRVLRGSDISPDWRFMPEYNNRELVALLAVNASGFVVKDPDALVASGAPEVVQRGMDGHVVPGSIAMNLDVRSGEVTALVAAGMLRHDGSTSLRLQVEDLQAELADLRQQIGPVLAHVQELRQAKVAGLLSSLGVHERRAQRADRAASLLATLGVTEAREQRAARLAAARARLGINADQFAAGDGDPDPKADRVGASASTRAQFANPWHDEVGRFAPKGGGGSGGGASGGGAGGGSGDPRADRVAAESAAANDATAQLEAKGIRDDTGRPAFVGSSGFTQPDGQQGVRLTTRIDTIADGPVDIAVEYRQSAAGSTYTRHVEVKGAGRDGTPISEPGRVASQVTTILDLSGQKAVADLGGKIADSYTPESRTVPGFERGGRVN